jgi:23S rRNA (adenine2503-C2)-methyltransferase
VLDVLDVLDSRDGARKYLLQLDDNERVEAVFLRLEDRDKDSICISSQVGCALKCAFCRTGLVGLRRQLDATEIVDQVKTVLLSENFVQSRTFDVSFMGMGEPLENLEEVLAAKEILASTYPAFRFCISTVGVVPGINRLAREAPDVILQVSLHAPTDDLRRRLMPITRKYPLSEVMVAAEEHAKTTGRIVVLNYCLIKDVNDSPQHASELVDLCIGRPFKVQVVRYNFDEAIPLEPPSDEAVRAFIAVLQRAGLPLKTSAQLGSLGGAGCGQLDADYAATRRPIQLKVL